MAEMTASVTLTLLDEISAPLKRITEGFQKIGNAEGFNRLASEINSAKNELFQAIEPTKVLDSSLAKIGANNGIGKIATQASESISIFERLSAVAGRVSTKFKTMSIGGGMKHAAENFHESVEKGIGSAFGAAAAGFGLVEPVREASEYDNTIRHIGIGLDIHGSDLDKFTGRLGLQMQELARATGQSSEKLVEAAGFFGREGYKLPDINAILPTIAKISTAYNSDPKAVAKATFALQENLGISHQDLSKSLASMAVSGKLADLPFEKLAPLFPELAASSGNLGIKGLSGSRDLLAELAVVRKSSGSEGEAVTNLKQLMEDVGQKTFGRSMKKFGVDSYAVMENARKHGENPLIAILNVLSKMTKGGTDKKMLAEFIHNQQAALAFNALMAHRDQYTDIRGKLESVDEGVIERDYNDGSKTMKIQMQRFDESFAQLTRRLGDDFAPVLAKVTIGIEGIEKGFEGLDQTFPKLSPVLLGIGGTVLAVTAGIAALGAIAGPLIAGISLFGSVLAAIVSPIGFVVAGVVAIGAAAYEAYKHFDLLKSWFLGFFGWIKNMISHPFKALYDSLVEAGSGTQHSIKDEKSVGDKISDWYSGLRGESAPVKAHAALPSAKIDLPENLGANDNGDIYNPISLKTPNMGMENAPIKLELLKSRSVEKQNGSGKHSEKTEAIQPLKPVSQVPDWMRSYDPNHPQKAQEVHVKISHEAGMKVSAKSESNKITISQNAGRVLGRA